MNNLTEEQSKAIEQLSSTENNLKALELVLAVQKINELCTR